MEKDGASINGGSHWMALEGGADSPPTGIHERRVVGEGEDSYTLALAAARDALEHADCDAEDLDVDLHYNYAEIDNPRINRELSRANVLTDPAARARIYAQVDRQITSQAYVIPWFWDNGIMLRAGDVDGVVSRFSSLWDLTFTAVQ